MFARPPKPPDAPTLLDRVVKSGVERLAIVSLHPGAGARRVLLHLATETSKRSWPFGVLSAPRVPLEPDPDPLGATTTVLPLPPGAWLATAEEAAKLAGDAFEIVERTEFETARGPVVLGRVAAAAEIELHGPVEPDALRAIAARLGERAGGVVFLEGGWERRAFAAPGTSDGIVPVLAAGYSANPSRSAAAMRYVVETLTAPPCSESARVAWEETASQGAAAMLSKDGTPLGVLPPGLEDPLPALRSPDGGTVGTVVLPHGLHDEFMIPLVRSTFRASLVVRDATRIHVSPVYYKAWLKGGGRIEVVKPLRIVAVATNPFNRGGPDADPEAFRAEVAKTLAGIPVHDVVLESDDATSRPLWKFW